MKHILPVDLGKYTLVKTWKTKLEFRSLRLLRVLCRSMAEEKHLGPSS